MTWVGIAGGLVLLLLGLYGVKQGLDNRRAGRTPPGTARADRASALLVISGLAVLAISIISL